MLEYSYTSEKINMLINPKNTKAEARSLLLRHLDLPKGTRAVVLSYIRDTKIREFMQSACYDMGIFLITNIDTLSLIGADIWITDVIDDSVPFIDLAKHRVVPVIPVSDNKIFSEFDPMKFTGNAFLFESVNQFQMFASLIRALENMRYAGDKRILLANVEKIGK